MHIVGVILLATIMSLIFIIIMYGVGYYGGDKLISKICSRSKPFERGIDKSRRLFNKYSNIAMFIGRLVPFSRTYMSILAGACKQDFFSYVFFSFLGLMISNTILISLGVSIFISFS